MLSSPFKKIRIPRKTTRNNKFYEDLENFRGDGDDFEKVAIYVNSCSESSKEFIESFVKIKGENLKHVRLIAPKTYGKNWEEKKIKCASLKKVDFHSYNYGNKSQSLAPMEGKNIYAYNDVIAPFKRCRNLETFYCDGSLKYDDKDNPLIFINNNGRLRSVSITGFVPILFFNDLGRSRILQKFNCVLDFSPLLLNNPKNKKDAKLKRFHSFQIFQHSVKSSAIAFFSSIGKKFHNFRGTISDFILKEHFVKNLEKSKTISILQKKWTQNHRNFIEQRVINAIQQNEEYALIEVNLNLIINIHLKGPLNNQKFSSLCALKQKFEDIKNTIQSALCEQFRDIINSASPKDKKNPTLKPNFSEIPFDLKKDFLDLLFEAIKNNVNKIENFNMLDKSCKELCLTENDNDIVFKRTLKLLNAFYNQMETLSKKSAGEKNSGYVNFPQNPRQSQSYVNLKSPFSLELLEKEETISFFSRKYLELLNFLKDRPSDKEVWISNDRIELASKKLSRLFKNTTGSHHTNTSISSKLNPFEEDTQILSQTQTLKESTQTENFVIYSPTLDDSRNRSFSLKTSPQKPDDKYSTKQSKKKVKRFKIGKK